MARFREKGAKMEDMKAVNEADQMGDLYSKTPYDRCPECGWLHVAIVASSETHKRCEHCGKATLRTTWKRLLKGEEYPIRLSALDAKLARLAGRL